MTQISVIDESKKTSQANVFKNEKARVSSNRELGAKRAMTIIRSQLEHRLRGKSGKAKKGIDRYRP